MVSTTCEAWLKSVAAAWAPFLDACSLSSRSCQKAEPALAAYKKLAGMTPDNYQVLNNYGALLRDLGDITTSQIIQ